MNAAHGHRLVEILIGIALLAFSGYEIGRGQTIGSWRTYDRDEAPWSFWLAILLQVAIAAAFLFGFTAWR